MISLGAEGINDLWRARKLRAVGMKRAQTLVDAAHDSVGLPGGACTRMELQMLIEDYRTRKNQLESANKKSSPKMKKLPQIL